MSRRPASAGGAAALPRIKLNINRRDTPMEPEPAGPSTRTRGGPSRIVSGESAHSAGKELRGAAMKKSVSAASTNESEEGGHGARHSGLAVGTRRTRGLIKLEEEQERAALDESRAAYAAEDHGDDGDFDEDASGEEDEEAVVEPRGRASVIAPASDDEDSDKPIPPRKPFPTKPQVITTRTGRQTTKANYAGEDSSESDFDKRRRADTEDEDLADEVHELGNGQSMGQRRRSLRNRGDVSGFVVDDERRPSKRSRVDGDRADGSTRRSSRKVDPDDDPGPSRSSRPKGKARMPAQEDEDYEGAGDESPTGDEEELPEIHEEDELNLHDGDTEDDENVGRRNTRGAARRGARARRGRDSSDEDSGVPRTLRARKQINYALPPPPEDVPRRGGGRGGVRIGGTASGIAAAAQNGGFMMNMNLGMAGDMANFGNMPDSDSDNDAPQFVKDLRKEASAQAGMALASGGPADAKGAGGGVSGPTIATAGVDALGRFNPEAAKADADPLGVDLNVTFDQVGGLDDHINQLKEMVALPLLYPELFQQFGIIPPRGVLFHGPPGTGKTLLARALAASCSTSTTKISFFMRKGADCLSKWVGEAERQLKLLFEEARNAQPSIIFFDEIDGLAPVRSSKQDQIHSSLVATLLALMDGMDGRGQVVVIGATNRPDTVDPALRRPGRFDREFYFPLPSKAARKKIIAINTRKWEPPLEDRFLEELAGQTKGYGGADLRALCTEAALNAIQRTFPQVYKTSDRLLLKPESIRVSAKDFMASIRKIVPSSARSAASAAIPLPEQLVPLLARSMEKTKKVVDQLLPPKTRPTVLEEAEWEEEDDSLEREMIMQSLETLRVYRPRLLIHSQHNLGQRFIGSAILHHMEGYHVQTLDVATLFAQTAGSMETAIVQMFIEAKRHQPSVLYIPSLADWVAVMPDSTKTTFSGLLESLTPSEPVLVLALLQGEKDELPPQMASWFGKASENFLELGWHDENQRARFFESTLDNLRRQPIDFPDGTARKRRILEVLPKAPPLAPKPPSQASIAAQAQKDQTLKEIITYRLGPILAGLKKKHKKATLSAQDAYVIHNIRQAEMVAAPPIEAQPATPIAAEAIVNLASGPDEPVAKLPAHIVDELGLGSAQIVPSLISIDLPSEGVDVIMEAVVREEQPLAVATDPPAAPAVAKPHWVDFDLMQNKLMDASTGYLTLRSFLRDIERMAENINMIHDDTDRRHKAHSMVVETKLMLKDHFQDEQQKQEMERMAAREHARRGKPAKSVEVPIVVTNGTASSVRANRKDRDLPSRQGTPSQSPTQNPKKRHRPDVSSPDIAKDLEAHAHKRFRHEEASDLDAGEKSADALAPTAPIRGLGNGLANLVNGHTSFLVTSAPPSSLASLMNPTQSPRPEHPEFYLPLTRVEEFQDLLKLETVDLDVEELEQIRAMCLQRIWKGRRDWNRTNVVEDLFRIVCDFIDTALPDRAGARSSQAGSGV